MDGADERLSQPVDNERQRSYHNGRPWRQRHNMPGPVPARSRSNDDETSQITASWRSSTPGSANEGSRPYDFITQRSSDAIGSMPPPSPPRTFAPGLALRKPKANPYDPQNRLAPKEEYTFWKERQDAEVRGAWTAIDPDSGTRLWDKRHYAEVAEREHARSEGRATSRASSVRPDPWSGWASSIMSDDLGDVQSIKSKSISTTSAAIDTRFENPDLDVDPEVREKFVGIQDVLRENKKPLSAFEQRNHLSYNASAPINVIIGGELVKTMVPKVDRRGELRDRHGNYIDGIDHGLMKKPFEEERKRKIEERDEQMEAATRERRAWMALSPEERERRLRKSQRNKTLVALLGAGVDDTDSADLFSYESIPNVYLRKVRPQSIARWTASNTSQASSASDDVHSTQPESPTYSLQSRASNSLHTNSGHGNNDTYIPLQDDEALFCSSPDSPRDADRAEKYNSPRRRPSNLLSSRSSAGLGNVMSGLPTAATPVLSPKAISVPSIRSDSIIRPRGGPTPSTLHSYTTDKRTPIIGSSSVTGSTLAFFDKGLELAPLQDTAVRRTEYDNNTSASRIARDRFDETRKVSTRRGRVITVRLHEPVKYGTSAIAQRLFGGVLQEIQYFPEDRAAIVVFVYPYEASGFLRHVKCAKENDAHSYRQLQLDAEWYGGHERDAIYPSQNFIMAAAVGENASRVLLINGVQKRKTTAEVAHDFKIRFYDMILVKVAVVPPAKRYVQARDGNMGIIEFASIKDAMEVRERFIARDVSDYTQCTVEFLQDSCDRGPGRQPYCDCLSCNGGRS